MIYWKKLFELSQKLKKLKKKKNRKYIFFVGEHFTYDLKLTLDRIDNDIGHEISNCKFSCQICTVLRERKDSEITCLRIQLKKYCLMNHLPTLITDAVEYHSLRMNLAICIWTNLIRAQNPATVVQDTQSSQLFKQFLKIGDSNF